MDEVLEHLARPGHKSVPALAGVQLTFTRIGSRFKRLQILLVCNGEHEDGRCRIQVGIWENRLKNRPHALELESCATTLFLRGVTNYHEVRGYDF